MQFFLYLVVVICCMFLFFIQYVIMIMFRYLLFRYLRFFECLGEYRVKCFVFVLIDFLFVFLVYLVIWLIIVSCELFGDGVDSCVKGLLFGLLVLLEGCCDVDVLFFLCDLVVVGDMEVMFVMCNVLDDISIDLLIDLFDFIGLLLFFVRSLFVQ